MAGTLEQKPSSTGRLQFPSHYDAESGHWMSFTRMKYQRLTAADTEKLVRVEGASTINLPVPPTLAKSYGAQWDTPDIGIVGNAVQEIAGDALSTATETFRKTGSLWASAADAFRSSGTVQNGKNLAQAYGISLLIENSAFRKAGASRIGAVARNPFKSVYFQSTQFRAFNMNFHLVATNYDEAVTIREIIKQFNVGMAPDFMANTQNALYTYPDLFQIDFERPEFLFKIAPCVLTDMNANYHSEGNALYFSKGEEKIPASLTLDLTFREVTILTRKDFEEGGY